MDIFRRIGGVVCAAALLWAGSAIAVQPLEISDVTVDDTVSPKQLQIKGANFDNGGSLEFWLGGEMLTILSQELEPCCTVVAVLPEGIEPGSYQLEVTTGGGAVRYNDFDGVTIGAEGPVGAVGPVGPQGPQGIQGEQGPIGPMGPQGIPGPQGAQGVHGEVGPIGPQGPQGEVGPVGPRGEQGIQGAPGPQGEQGTQGPIGPPGLNGADGAPGIDGQDGSSCSAAQGAGSATVTCTDGTTATVFDGAEGPPGPAGLSAPDRTAALCALYEQLSNAGLISLAVPEFCTPQPKLVFVTSGIFSGDLTGGVVGGSAGILAADQICNDHAAAAALVGNYKAWISSDDFGVRERFAQSPAPYQLVDGTQIAPNWNGLTDNFLDAPINVTENGVIVSGSVWTGTNPDGTLAQDIVGEYACNGWGVGTADFLGQTGSTDGVDATWTRGPRQPCDTATNRLYCFQQ